MDMWIFGASKLYFGENQPITELHLVFERIRTSAKYSSVKGPYWSQISPETGSVIFVVSRMRRTIVA